MGSVSIVALIVAMIGLALYFVPTIIAINRNHQYRWVILALNVVGGWTAIGWIVAFVWSVWPHERALVEPFVGNVTGNGYQNAGDAVGAAAHGIERGRATELYADRDRVPTQAPLASQLDQLERLLHLKQAGALNEDEFQAQKRALLG